VVEKGGKKTGATRERTAGDLRADVTVSDTRVNAKQSAAKTKQSVEKGSREEKGGGDGEFLSRRDVNYNICKAEWI
jgi:hypothetical protein